MPKRKRRSKPDRSQGIRPRTRSHLKREVAADTTIPSTVATTGPVSNLVTGLASNETNSEITTTTTATATTAAAIDVDVRTSPGSSRTNETVRRTLFSPANTADEAAIDNEKTEQSESYEEQAP